MKLLVATTANFETMASATTPPLLLFPPGSVTTRLSDLKKSVEANSFIERRPLIAVFAPLLSVPMQKTRFSGAPCLKSLLECAKRHCFEDLKIEVGSEEKASVVKKVWIN